MSPVLAVLIWLGNACLWMRLLNLLYSRPLHRQFLKQFRLLSGIVIFLAFPYLLVQRYPDYLTFDSHPLTDAWFALCLFAAVVVVPVVTLQRHRRPTPKQVLAESTTTVDIAERLGQKPIGSGKYHRFAALPWNNIFTVDYTTLTLAPDRLPPEWDGLTILHLSDIHLIGTPAQSFYEAAFLICMEQPAPDLLIFTGDLIDTNAHLEWIEPLLGLLKWNCVAVGIMGNHDWSYDHPAARRRLEDLGFHILGNAWKTLEVRGIPATFIGHEGPWFRPAPDLSEAPANDFRLLLSHTPDNLPWARENGVSLMLSGHVHGGQIRLPVFGSLFVPSWFGRKYDMGNFYESGTLLHVNRGLAGKEPLRYNCHPQITRIVLKRVE